MTNDWDAHFSSVLAGCFPDNAERHARVESDDICIYVDWKLSNDPGRPNKRSKKIKIRITQSAIEDYLDSPAIDKATSDRRLTSMVSEWMNSIDPDHNFPAEVPVPIIEFVVTTEMLTS